jgi:hypothetical protein
VLSASSFSVAAPQNPAATRSRDDDIQFVGTLDEHGLFTPNLDGPNTKRSGNRNNVGDVWVVATLKDSASTAPARPVRARASARHRAAVHELVYRGI